MANTPTSTASYDEFLKCSRQRGGATRLTHEPGGWGLVTTLPAASGTTLRAAGFIFSDLRELHHLAELLHAWLDIKCGDPRTEGEQR